MGDPGADGRADVAGSGAQRSGASLHPQVLLPLQRVVPLRHQPPADQPALLRRRPLSPDAGLGAQGGPQSRAVPGLLQRHDVHGQHGAAVLAAGSPGQLRHRRLPLPLPEHPHLQGRPRGHRGGLVLQRGRDGRAAQPLRVQRLAFFLGLPVQPGHRQVLQDVHGRAVRRRHAGVGGFVREGAGGGGGASQENDEAGRPPVGGGEGEDTRQVQQRAVQRSDGALLLRLLATLVHRAGRRVAARACASHRRLELRHPFHRLKLCSQPRGVRVAKPSLPDGCQVVAWSERFHRNHQHHDHVCVKPVVHTVNSR